jgi:rRNA maturation endonuclease Nob1
MPFCSNCGNEITAGTKFCGSCGKEQIASADVCTKCGKTLEENEKFCSSCGTAANVATKVTPKPKTESRPEPSKPKLTKEGKKIIDTGPKPVNKRPAGKPVPNRNSSGKKKRSSLGCFFRTIFILASIVIGAVVLIYVANIFIEDDGNTVPNTQKTAKNEEGQLSGTDIPGIVDIKPGDETATEIQAEKQKVTSIKESGDIKESAEQVEEIFAKADTAQLKLLLTETSLKTYMGSFSAIKPYMAEYAKAFKNRKLINTTKNYALYSFKDAEGNEYTTEFALLGDGNWKLVRF